MKVSKEQVAHHKKQILAAAARLFRQRGFERRHRGGDHERG